MLVLDDHAEAPMSLSMLFEALGHDARTGDGEPVSLHELVTAGRDSGFLL